MAAPLHVRLATMMLLACACIAPRALALSAGAPAPSFALLDAQGGLVSLEKLRGQVVYVDFWASWCGPCRRSFPFMNELHARYGHRGLAIVAVNVDRNRADAERLLQQVPASFRIVFDAAGVTPLAWGAGAMPSSYIIDPRGTIVQVEQGFRDERRAVVEERIRSLLPAR